MPIKKAINYSALDGESKFTARQEDYDAISDLQWNKDGSAFVTVSEKNNVVLWNEEGKLKHSYQGHSDSVL